MAGSADVVVGGGQTSDRGFGIVRPVLVKKSELGAMKRRAA